MYFEPVTTFRRLSSFYYRVGNMILKVQFELIPNISRFLVPEHLYNMVQV